MDTTQRTGIMELYRLFMNQVQNMTLLIILGLHRTVICENTLAFCYMLGWEWSRKKKLLSQSQGSFRKNYRTTDHIMTLLTWIKKSLREVSLHVLLILEKLMTQYADRGLYIDLRNLG